MYRTTGRSLQRLAIIPERLAATAILLNMHIKLRSYTTWSIACFVVWAIIFAVGLIFNLHRDNHLVVYVFAGWVIGWLGATIARHMYK